MQNDLDRVCAWCKKDMGTKPSAETGTTHGICPECIAKIEKEEMAVNAPLPKSMDEKAADGRALFGSVKNEGFYFNGVRWKYEDGILYQFTDDRWLYKSEEVTLEKAKSVAEIQSHAFAAK